MAVCKVCDKSYHACSSCGLSDWEYDFCSSPCRDKFREEHLPPILDKYNLTTDQLKSLLEELAPLYIDF